MYRDLVLRVVAASCKLVRRADELQDTGQDTLESHDEFEAQVISAFGEAFNNIAIHGYADHPGEVRMEIETEQDAITIRVFDDGRTFDPTRVALPQALPESGMGLYIIRSFMDEVTYQPGNPPRTPNMLCMKKRRSAAA